MTKFYILLLTGLLIYACDTSKTSEEKQSEDSVQLETKTEEVSKRPAPVDSALLLEYEEAKVGWFVTIRENDEMIAKLKSAIQAEKQTERAVREVKLKLLDHLNSKQKTKIALFKPDNQEHWTRFENMMDEDLKQINEDLKTLMK